MAKSRPSGRPPAAAPTPKSPRVLPLGALLLAGSMGAVAQAPADSGKSLPAVTVKEQPEPEETKAKSTLRAKETTTAKGKQALRDVPEQDGFPHVIDWPVLAPELLTTGE